MNRSGSTSSAGTGNILLDSMVAAGGVSEVVAVLVGVSEYVGAGVGNRVGVEIGPAERSKADAALGLQPPGTRAARVRQMAKSFLPEYAACLMGNIPLALASR